MEVFNTYLVFIVVENFKPLNLKNRQATVTPKRKIRKTEILPSRFAFSGL